MDQLFKARLKKLIISHEDKSNFPYVDTKGNVTIGIGYNLTARGLPDAWINEQYDQDVTYFHTQLTHDFDWYEKLCDERKMVLIDMCFMGYKTFKEFKLMLAALEKGDYEEASYQIMNSEWAEQVHGRAKENAEIMRTGVLCSQQA